MRSEKKKNLSYSLLSHAFSSSRSFFVARVRPSPRVSCVYHASGPRLRPSRRCVHARFGPASGRPQLRELSNNRIKVQLRQASSYSDPVRSLSQFKGLFAITIFLVMKLLVLYSVLICRLHYPTCMLDVFEV